MPPWWYSLPKVVGTGPNKYQNAAERGRPHEGAVRSKRAARALALVLGACPASPIRMFLLGPSEGRDHRGGPQIPDLRRRGRFTVRAPGALDQRLWGPVFAAGRPRGPSVRSPRRTSPGPQGPVFAAGRPPMVPWGPRRRPPGGRGRERISRRALCLSAAPAQRPVPSCRRYRAVAGRRQSGSSCHRQRRQRAQPATGRA